MNILGKPSSTNGIPKVVLDYFKTDGASLADMLAETDVDELSDEEVEFMRSAFTAGLIRWLLAGKEPIH